MLVAFVGSSQAPVSLRSARGDARRGVCVSRSVTSEWRPPSRGRIGPVTKSISMGLGIGSVVIPGLDRLQLAKRATFHLGEFLARSVAHKLLVLLALSLLFVLLGGMAFIAVDRAGREAEDPFWSAVRGVVNPFEDDWHSNPLRIVSIVVASLGVIFFGILINILTESVESSIATLASGYTPVLASNHVVHIGRTNAQSSALLSATLRRHPAHFTSPSSSSSPTSAAADVVTKSAMHVLMVPDDGAYTEALEKVEDVATGTGGHRVECRVGSVFSKEDLERVGVERAAAVVLSTPDGLDSNAADRVIIGQLVALRQAAPNFKGRVLAQLATVPEDDSHSNNKNVTISSDDVAKSVFKHSANGVEVETVRAEELLGRFLVQALQQPGLNAIVSSMMDGNACHAVSIRTVQQIVNSSAQHKNCSAVVGKTLRQVVNDDDSGAASASSGFLGSGAMVCGYIEPKSGKAVLEVLSDEIVLEEGTELVMFGALNSDANIGRIRERSVNERSEPLRLVQPGKLMHERQKASTRRRVLICGWREGMGDMLSELDATLPKGSSVTILADESTGCASPVEMRAVLSKLKPKNTSVNVVHGRPDRYESLEKVFARATKKNDDTPAFDHVVTLAMRDTARGESAIVADGRSLNTLAYLQSLVKDAVRTTVTVQFSNEQFEQLAWETTEEVDNVLLPNAISARLASETLADPRLNTVWTELLSQYGREVYLRPARDFTARGRVEDGPAVEGGGGGEKESFATIARRALRTGDVIPIGYATEELGAVLCPTADAAKAPREWREEDVLIVLAHQ